MDSCPDATVADIERIITVHLAGNSRDSDVLSSK